MARQLPKWKLDYLDKIGKMSNREIYKEAIRLLREVSDSYYKCDGEERDLWKCDVANDELVGRLEDQFFEEELAQDE